MTTTQILIVCVTAVAIALIWASTKASSKGDQ